MGKHEISWEHAISSRMHDGNMRNSLVVAYPAHSRISPSSLILAPLLSLHSRQLGDRLARSLGRSVCSEGYDSPIHDAVRNVEA